MIPVARTEKLLIQEVGNELIVYDQENNASHCLNPMAARVWHYCDGNNTINDIAKLLEKELNIAKDSDVDIRGLVYLTLEELERYNLIKDYVKQPIGASGISRRKVVKMATLVGGFAIGSMFPLVRSIVAPEAAMAASPCPASKLLTVPRQFPLNKPIEERDSIMRDTLNIGCELNCGTHCNSSVPIATQVSCTRDVGKNGQLLNTQTCTISGTCICSKK
ncbi:MAG: PqqD family protein [Microcystis aeruginosa LG13-03]|nr:PqqD family protein [Microcystis aeruginosa LG13-13]NCR06043.1 PqqD family protein [Microcystis aeruginosa LG13-03]NCR64303.1 PqqD family protein [Microcystis aeruginosa LG11-05]